VGVILQVLLFVSSHCPHCPKAERAAKEVVPDYEDRGVMLSKIRAKTESGKELCQRYGIRAMPTILLAGGDGKEIKRIVGVPSEDGLRRDIEQALGLRKSFLSRIFGGRD
jgi:thiol-disulfide isomerase/thioredoxin